MKEREVVFVRLSAAAKVLVNGHAGLTSDDDQRQNHRVEIKLVQ